jgi:hypothetical protein
MPVKKKMKEFKRSQRTIYKKIKEKGWKIFVRETVRKERGRWMTLSD